jgi:hypothetical protein
MQRIEQAIAESAYTNNIVFLRTSEGPENGASLEAALFAECEDFVETIDVDGDRLVEYWGVLTDNDFDHEWRVHVLHA